MEKNRLAYIEDLINELADELDEKYQAIYNDKEYDTPSFLKILEKRTLAKEEVGYILQVFSGAFDELKRLDEGDDEKLNEQYEWLSEEKRKKLISVVDTLVSDCLRVYTDLDPDAKKLEENIRKIFENEKEETHQEE